LPRKPGGFEDFSVEKPRRALILSLACYHAYGFFSGTPSLGFFYKNRRYTVLSFL
jgi:hypothetical protein